MDYQSQNFPEQEKEILKFWEKEKIFEKSLKKTENGPRFIFFEGPPFANGLPGIHHLLARAFKDIIIRYKTMCGFFIERKAGWDTHGLPTEMAAEKELGVKSKKDIDKIGIEKFIQVCKENIFTYKKEWEDFSRRIGFWLDFENAYITCSRNYIESLWWILKKIWDKGLLYKDYKVVPYCPRCGTSLSSHEVAQGYKTIKEESIYIKFPVKNQKDTYFLVWTTTPWTLPGNVALAVGENIDYLKIRIPGSMKKYKDIEGREPEDCQDYRKKDNFYIIAKDLFENLRAEFKSMYCSEESEFKGKDLIGLEYEPLYNFIKPDKPAYKVIAGDFVTTEEGTGIVHIAPAFGEDDMKAGKENDLPVLMTVDEEGKFKKEIAPWAGKFVKEADPLITKDLEKRDLLFKKEMYEHEYPFCWRCGTPLLYYAKDSWFIKMTAVKEELIKNNKKINWIPKHLKDGRFGEWLNELKDWNLSRERYWGAPLPVWKCGNDKCNHVEVIGSIKELREMSYNPVPENPELHRPAIDDYHFNCPKCGSKPGEGGIMSRVPEVIDCWFDSGSMPYAQWHYPFENQEKIDEGEFFPADFICEGIDQTRGWFYTLLAVSALLDLGISYKNVISLGLVLDAKGQKMSKSKGNVVQPKEVIDKLGADCARFYFYTVNQAGEPKRFNLKEAEDLYKRFFLTLWNSFSFFETYTKNLKIKSQKLKIKNILDKWIVSRLNSLNISIKEKLDDYDIVSAARMIDSFVDDLSNWYIRRSRKRFQRPKDKREKEEAVQTLYYVLLNLAKISAPFIPFFSEKIYQGLTKGKENQSVHLSDWPKADKNLIDKNLEEKMETVREIVAQALAQRAEAGIKIRQPIASLKIKNQKSKIKNDRELLNLIKGEINVKEIVFDEKIKSAIELDRKITPELKEEGTAREIARLIQSARKKAGFVPQDLISTEIVFLEKNLLVKKILKKQKDYIKEETNSSEFKVLSKISKGEFDFEKEITFEDKKICLRLKKK